ncbi:energy transducer TonB, partial [Thermodesulfobacteriota bacterium]
IPIEPEEVAEVSEEVFQMEEYAAVEATGPVEEAAPISAEEYHAQYLKAHFQYIREDIQHQVVYPRIARKKGWQGKVVLKFIVCEDGRVMNVEVVESSGYAVLDKNAMKSVRSAAPFPKPPVRAELIIPIRYGLV